MDQVTIRAVIRVGIFVAIYFVPTLIALTGRHPNRRLIFLINCLGGWTVAGWIVALVMAVGWLDPAGPRTGGRGKRP